MSINKQYLENADVMDTANQRKQRYREMFSDLSEENKETLLALIEKLNTDGTSDSMIMLSCYANLRCVKNSCSRYK